MSTVKEFTKICLRDKLFDDLLAEDAELRRRWREHESSRKLALTLIGLRRKVGLTQKALAAVARWDQAYVSRLESGRHPLPEPSTVRRYVAACQGKAAYLIVDADGEAISIDLQ